uniref:Uncharacterized protein n=1 Tax=viral metagenome TaxID=1070528 RepID=A0A6M3KNQ0_9ZZZZ
MAKNPLDTIRQRYPTYKEVDDLSLATAFTKKYPQYRPILEEVMSRSQKDLKGVTTPPERPRPTKDLYSLWGAEVTPEMKKTSPYLSATAKTAQEGIATPTLHFLNMAGLNLPRAVASASGYKYPESKTLPGTILSKGAGVVGGVTSPITRSIAGIGEKIPTVAKLAGVKGGAIKGAIGGAGLGAAYTPTEDVVGLKQRGIQALIGGGIGVVVGAGVAGFKQALLRKADKVNKIRKSMQDFSRKETKAYGQMEKQLGKDGKEIDPIEALNWMERQLFERGMINEAGEKIAKAGASKVDKGLYKTYTDLTDAYLKSPTGKIPTEATIKAGRDIKASGGKPRVKFKPTESGREAQNLKQDFMKAIKPKINSKNYDAMNKRYGKYKTDFETVDKHFKIWEPDWSTGKGEKALTNLARSGEMLRVADVIKQTTGINVTPDIILSYASNPVIRQLARDAGFVAAIWYAVSRQVEGGGDSSQNTSGGT